MAPRSYEQRQRAESAEVTRRRILIAAVQVYRDEGVVAASIRAVAERADVSRGSILHHFGDAAGLLEAVLDMAVAEIEIPGRRVLDGAGSLDDRLRRYVDAMARFYDRTSGWWKVFGRDLETVPALRARTADFWAAIGDLQAAALGSAAADRVVAGAVSSLVDPGTIGTFRSRGLSLDEVIEIVGDLVIAVVRRPATPG